MLSSEDHPLQDVLWPDASIESITIVERADFDPEDEFLGECLRSIESRHPRGMSDTGSPARNRRSWNVLRIFLSDGAVLKGAAAQFVAEAHPVTGGAV